MRFMAALVCAAALSGCSVEADFSDALQVEILVAEEYMQEIAAIDRLLFTEEPLGEKGVKQLEQVIGGLAKRVGAVKKDSKFLRLESLELQLLAKQAARLPKDGTGAPLQDTWMRIRNNLFDDRAWFVRSAKDLDYAASVVHAAPPDPEPDPEPKPVPLEPLETIPRTADPSASLTGTWRVATVSANGAPHNDPELENSTWTFDPPRLVIDNGKEQTTFNYSGEEPYYLSIMTSAGKEGWMKYEYINNGVLIAFYDGLRAKPKSFTPPPGQKDPMLVVLQLQPGR